MMSAFGGHVNRVVVCKKPTSPLEDVVAGDLSRDSVALRSGVSKNTSVLHDFAKVGGLFRIQPPFLYAFCL